LSGYAALTRPTLRMEKDIEQLFHDTIAELYEKSNDGSGDNIYELILKQLQFV